MVAKLTGFEQEWQRESKLVSLARERERARLRPLLERCLDLAEHWQPDRPSNIPLREQLLTDLRREMGLPEKGER